MVKKKTKYIDNSQDTLYYVCHEDEINDGPQFSCGIEEVKSYIANMRKDFDDEDWSDDSILIFKLVPVTIKVSKKIETKEVEYIDIEIFND